MSADCGQWRAFRTRAAARTHVTACSAGRLYAMACVSRAFGRQNARWCVQCRPTLRNGVRFGWGQEPKCTWLRAVPVDHTQRRALPARLATRMHAGACSAGRPRALACVSHDGDGAVYPVRQARGRRGRRDPRSLPNKGHVFEITVSFACRGGMAPSKAAGQGYRE